MKSPLLAILIIASFLGIAVFGALAMGDKGPNHRGCIAATATQTACPENDTDSVAFHANAFRAFSTATFAPSAISLIALAVLAFAVFVFSRISLRENPFRRILLTHPPSRAADTLIAERELFLRSLALRELSPTPA